METSSQSSTSSLEGDADGREKSESWGSEEGTKPKKPKTVNALRMKELKKDWTKLLEETRQHRTSSDAEAKRKEWLEKGETIYEQYATLAEPGTKEED